MFRDLGRILGQTLVFFSPSQLVVEIQYWRDKRMNFYTYAQNEFYRVKLDDERVVVECGNYYPYEIVTILRNRAETVLVVQDINEDREPQIYLRRVASLDLVTDERERNYWLGLLRYEDA
jgi:hypothetical protein